MKFLNKLLEPRSTNEDNARRERILNVLLLGSSLLTGIVTILAFIDEFIESDSSGIPPLFLFGLFLICLFLLFLTRIGFFKIASYSLITILFFPITYALFRWGINLPTGLLGYALVIVMSGVLLSTRASFNLGVIATITLFFINYAHNHNLHTPKLYWRTEEIVGNGEVITYVTLLMIMMIVAWLFNREMEKSLIRAHQSEQALREERDLLESKVEERTKELKQAQLEKVMQLYHFAEFGKLSSGFFHDLASPLTAVSLNLSRVKDNNLDALQNTKGYLDQAISAAKRMEEFVCAIQKQIQRQDTNSIFSIKEEIDQAVQILNYKAKRNSVTINIKVEPTLTMSGDAIKFYQIISNLVSNAIDAYIEIPNMHNRVVTIQVSQRKDAIVVRVHDFGCGITPGNMETIFEPFATTKSPEVGTGLGLSSTKTLVEKNFNGTITVTSSSENGTEFIVTLPQQ